MPTDEGGCQNLTCKAVRKTWANQRRKRRLAAKQHQQTASKKAKESTELEADPSDEQKQDIVPVPTEGIASISCNFEFTCILHKTGDINLVQFKWLCGDSKDNLHQITQYLKNQAQLSVQASPTNSKQQ